MTYTKLGNSCTEVSIALTDNKKFIPFNDSVYKLKYTITDLYPGSSNVVGQNHIKQGNIDNPDFIKQFYGKNTLPEISRNISKPNRCNNCVSK